MAGFPGYGIGGYGVSPYGGIGTGVTLSAAFALDTRTVRVTVVGVPKRSSPFATGDALNPATWALVNLATSKVYSVIQVTMVQDPDVFDVRVLENIGPITEQHRISSTTLQSTHNVTISAPTQIDFAGVLAEALSTPDKVTADRGLATTDIDNPPFARGVDPAGTLVITAGGDYALVDGQELVRKLVIRRLIAVPGDFFHMPSYGVGLRLKGIYTPSDLVALKAEIERQVRQEPEVASVKASPRISNGTLSVSVEVTLAPTGQKLTVQARSNVTNGALEF